MIIDMQEFPRPQADAFNAGYDAFYSGDHKGINPWPMNDYRYEHWHQGWSDAYAEEMERNPPVRREDIY